MCLYLSRVVYVSGLKVFAHRTQLVFYLEYSNKKKLIRKVTVKSSAKN